MFSHNEPSLLQPQLPRCLSGIESFCTCRLRQGCDWQMKNGEAFCMIRLYISGSTHLCSFYLYCVVCASDNQFVSIPLLSSVAQSCSSLCDPMDCSTPGLSPSPTPGAYSNSCPLSRWYHPTISSSVIPFSFSLQSFPVSGSIQMQNLYHPYHGHYI